MKTIYRDNVEIIAVFNDYINVLLLQIIDILCNQIFKSQKVNLKCTPNCNFVDHFDGSLIYSAKHWLNLKVKASV